MSNTLVIVIFIGFVLWPFFLPSVQVVARQQGMSAIEAKIREERLPDMGIPVDGRIVSVEFFYLNDAKSFSPSGPRLAVLWWNRESSFLELTILRPVDGEWMAVYHREELQDQKMDIVGMGLFPAAKVHGVVLSSGIEWGNEYVAVIGHVDGKFQIIYEGANVTFLNVNDNGMPEAYSFDRAKSLHSVHAWNGKEYVFATSFKKWGDRYSETVVAAVQEVAPGLPWRYLPPHKRPGGEVERH